MREKECKILPTHQCMTSDVICNGHAQHSTTQHTFIYTYASATCYCQRFVYTLCPSLFYLHSHAHTNTHTHACIVCQILTTHTVVSFHRWLLLLLFLLMFQLVRLHAIVRIVFFVDCALSLSAVWIQRHRILWGTFPILFALWSMIMRHVWKPDKFSLNFTWFMQQKRQE